MTISDAYVEAMTAIHVASADYWAGKLTFEQAQTAHATILEVYDDQMQRIRSAELAKHTHDFSIP